MKNIITFLLFLIILTSTVMAYDNYPTPGYQKYNDYISSGVLALNTTIAVMIPGTLTLNGSIPLVDDLDNDGINEIVLMTSNDYLYVQNFTGTTLNNLANANIGSANLYSASIHVTPGIIDYDLDLNREIVTMNSTHLLVYNYTYSTGLVLEQSTPLLLTNVSGTALGAYVSFPIMKCSVAGNYGGIKACYVLIPDHNGAVYDFKLIQYDLTNNAQNNATLGTGLWTNANKAMYKLNPGIIDLDLNGVQDVVVSADYSGTLRTYYVKQTGASTLSVTSVYDLVTAGGYYFSEPSVGDFDGIASNGDEIGFFYQSSATKYSARIIDRSGAVLNTFSTDVLVAGSTPMVNLMSWGSTPALFCAFVHYATYDTIICFDGDGATQQSTTGNSVGYTVNGGGTFSLVDSYDGGVQGFINGGYASHFTSSYQYLLNWYTTAPSTNITPFYASGGYTHAAVLDLRQNGMDDVLYSNLTTYAVLNTLASNTAPSITAYGTGTGMPSCLGVVQKYHVTLNDAEDDKLNCHFGYYYNNDTLISQQVKNGSSDVQFEFLYTLAETGSFKATVTCGDNWNKNSTSHTFIQTVSNTTGCYNQDIGGTDVTVEEEAAAAENAAFEEDVDTFFSSLGLGSPKAKSVIAIIIVILIAVLIFMKTQSTLLSVASIPLMMLLCYFIGLIGIFSLVMMIIITVALLVMSFFRQQSNVGG